MPSVVRANRIWAAESRDVAEVLGKVTLEELEQVQSAFRKAFGL